jgi:anthranilate synthase component 1
LLIDRAVVFDHWRQRLVLVIHAQRDGYDEAIAAIEALAASIASAAPLPLLGPAEADGAAGEPNMSDQTYRDIVTSFQEHILAGDIFQGVPSRRVSFPAPDGGLPIYRRLRVSNPAPYMFYLRALGMELAGSSPEPLVRVEGRRVVTRPIAGTRPRGLTDVRDRLLEHELLADPKEQAEHAMLVDLARNDLGRVCVPGTVRPTELMEVERFSKVMHIVSTIEGDLRPDMEPFDALAVTFPAGTVTGAPKRRAMELIAEHEPTPRGPYAGAVGYLTFAGDLDFCITIRTAVVADGQVSIQAGAGIVADSDPETELRETQAKAAALLPAVAPQEAGR